ncbi:hypothetical protein PoB_001607500 [Plakobranchus ocellatus]|uniref:Uncharacterized protein n=1 Tax=Plakobranchus ocellatus TaxID=259542 RepID=A0AAV3Z2F1_9GAST|nr:hypothetical protein PoB_001607500 [Plakobranchus ocellatus]
MRWRRQRKCDGAEFGLLCKASSQKDFPRLSGSQSGQGAGGVASNPRQRVTADLWMGSLATVPPPPHQMAQKQHCTSRHPNRAETLIGIIA